MLFSFSNFPLKRHCASYWRPKMGKTRLNMLRKKFYVVAWRVKQHLGQRPRPSKVAKRMPAERVVPSSYQYKNIWQCKHFKAAPDKKNYTCYCDPDETINRVVHLDVWTRLTEALTGSRNVQGWLWGRTACLWLIYILACGSTVGSRRRKVDTNTQTCP